MFCGIRLAKLGYYGGNPENVLNAPVEMVMAVLQYENFDSELNLAYNALIREDAG